MRIFFAGPLTDLENPEKTKEFYNSMDNVAKDLGFETFWAFKSGTDPVINPNVEPEYIYFKDLAELEKSNLMIAYVGEATTGTGQELEYAREHNIPAYLVFEKNRHVSRMIIGNPTVNGTIEYETEAEALLQLHKLLSDIKSRLEK